MRRLTIGGVKWKVYGTDTRRLFDDGTLGLCDGDRREILLGLQQKNDEVRLTLAHEVAHASIWFLNGKRRLTWSARGEERWVRQYEAILKIAVGCGVCGIDLSDNEIDIARKTVMGVRKCARSRNGSLQK